MSSSPSPVPRPSNEKRPRLHRFILGLVIGGIAAILGFLIGVAYFLLN